MAPALDDSKRSASLSDAVTLVGACSAPSEAFWRLLELEAVRASAPCFRSPVMELGCGDGVFTKLTGIAVALGTDRESRAIERATRLGAYTHVRQLDLHDIGAVDVGVFGTIFANSVLEHVPQLDLALPHIRAALSPGGRLIATVPLDRMNDHLSFQDGRYVKWRQRQLQHRNLWSTPTWESKLLAAGFSEVTWLDYLPARACRAWDRADVLATLGGGRYRAAPALHHLASHLMPSAVRMLAKRSLARLIVRRAAALQAGPPCAAVLCAVT